MPCWCKGNPQALGRKFDALPNAFIIIILCRLIRSLRCLFYQRMRSRDNNQVAGVYELKLKHRIDIDSPGLISSGCWTVVEHLLKHLYIIIIIIIIFVY